MNPKVLFIADKWCAGNREFGLAEWEGNLVTTLKESGLAREIELFHFDNYFLENRNKHNKSGDEACLEKIKQYKPDIIVLIIYRMPGEDVNVPTWDTVKRIKKEYQIPIIAIWGDLENKKQVKISKAINSYITLHLATAALSAVKKMGHPEKYVYMWVPKDPKIFNNPNKERNIVVSYAGTPKESRLKTINYLKQNDIPVFHTGGERQAHLTTEEYADIFKRSKITLSFSRNSDSHTINARPFEAMLCGTMVLEQESIEAPRLYIPFIDYVPYSGNKDLLKKVKYYLEHDAEREMIAKNGYHKTTNYYSSDKFWKFAIDRIINKDNSSPYTDEPAMTIKKPDLSRLSKWRALKLRFLWILCSNNFGFKLYHFFKNAFNWRFYRSLVYRSLVSIVPNLKRLKGKL